MALKGEGIKMQINYMNNNEVRTIKFYEWSDVNRQGSKNFRKYADDVIAVVIERMRRWGYLTDNDISNKIPMVSYDNRVDFLITVVPRLKGLFNKIFQSQ